MPWQRVIDNGRFFTVSFGLGGLLRLRIFLQFFRKNAKKSPIYGLLAAKAACRVKNRLKAILGI
jgi:hypothetical protein